MKRTEPKVIELDTKKLEKVLSRAEYLRKPIPQRTPGRRREVTVATGPTTIRARKRFRFRTNRFSRVTRVLAVNKAQFTSSPSLEC